jgi:Ca2+-binding EF-hand superfamily protein
MRKNTIVFIIICFFVFPAIANAYDSDLFNIIDMDKNGVLSMEEFQASSLKISIEYGYQRLVSVNHFSTDRLTETTKIKYFKLFDHDSNGVIDKSEWSSVSSEGFVKIRWE